MMNGIERIIARIESDEQAKTETVLKNGRAEAAAIADEYRMRAEKETAALQEKAEKTAREHEERLVSAAVMENRQRILAVRQELVDQAFEEALDALCSMPHAEYVEILTALLLRASVSGHEEVIFSRADRERVGEEAVLRANAAGNSLVLSDETRSIRGGFILRSARVEINCAFETLVRLQRGQCAAQTAKILFSEE